MESVISCERLSLSPKSNLPSNIWGYEIWDLTRFWDCEFAQLVDRGLWYGNHCGFLVQHCHWLRPFTIKGRLWIHAAGKVPEPDTIKAMEDFYREIYGMNRVTDIKFPDHYPISRFLGCVDVVGCVSCEELTNWEAIPASVNA